MFHHEGLTDLSVMRREAQALAKAGQTVFLHMHPYNDMADGCGEVERTMNHESYGTKVTA